MKQFFNKNKYLGINETIIVVAIMIGAFGLYHFFGPEEEYGFICPSDFKESEEYLYSVTQWISKYTKEHPEAKVEEMMEVRDKLAEKYKCGKTLFEVSENVVEEVEEEIDTAKLMEGIKYAESQREDVAADALIKTIDEKELLNIERESHHMSFISPKLTNPQGLHFFIIVW